MNIYKSCGNYIVTIKSLPYEVSDTGNILLLEYAGLLPKKILGSDESYGMIIDISHKFSDKKLDSLNFGGNSFKLNTMTFVCDAFNLRERAFFWDFDKENYTGVFKSWHPPPGENIILEEYYYIDGKINNTYTSFYINGKKCTEGVYIDNHKEGVYESWHENGILKIKCTYVQDKKEGVYESWHENGVLAFKCLYLNDNKEGIYKKWHKNGENHIHACYKNDFKYGAYKNWYENGSLHISCNYLRNEKHGPYRKYYADGSINVECIYNTDDLSGVCNVWYNNSLRKSVHDTNTKIYKSWYINGEVHSIITPSLFRSWYENGGKEEEYTIVGGKPCGLYKNWHLNGILNEECIYKNGKIRGEYKKWGDDGVLIEAYTKDTWLARLNKYFSKSSSEYSKVSTLVK